MRAGRALFFIKFLLSKSWVVVVVVVFLKESAFRERLQFTKSVVRDVGHLCLR